MHGPNNQIGGGGLGNRIGAKARREYYTAAGGNTQGQGDGKSQQGQVVGKAKGQQGSGEGKAGDSPGTDYYETDVTLEELVDIMFEDLELPDLERKALRQIEAYRLAKRKGYRQVGIRIRLDKRRTVRERVKRKLATARRHAELAPQLERLAERTAATRTALVHGDVSPKNILVGAQGPVFLDAECAWYGDPAFDLAFCLNHMLLKCIWVPAFTGAFLSCFDALGKSYFHFESNGDKDMEQRVATLLPGLLLARIDGKSPVEYISAEADKARVRKIAKKLLLNPPSALAEVRAAWQES